MIGARIREARETLGLSQAALATATGSAKTTIQQYERNDNMPGGKFLRAMMDLGVSVNWLLGGQAPMMLGKGERDQDQASAPAPALDDDLLHACIVGVEEHLAAAGKRLAPDKKADLIIALAHLVTENKREGAEDAHPVGDWIARMVKLAS